MVRRGDAPNPYDVVTTHRRRARWKGLLVGSGVVLAVHGFLLYIQFEIGTLESWSDPGLIYQIAIAGGILLPAARFAWWQARVFDDANYMIQKTTPMPLRLVGEHDDVWLEGKLRCPSPLKPPFFRTRCAWYHYTVEEHRGSGKSSTWVTVGEMKRQSATWLQQGNLSIRLDLRRAAIEYAPNTMEKRGSRRHTLTYLRASGHASASGVVRRTKTGTPREKQAIRPPSGSPAAMKAEGKDPLAGLGRGLRGRMMARSRSRKEKRAKKLVIRPPKNSPAWKRRRQEEVEDSTPVAAGEKPPTSKWLLTEHENVQIMVTPHRRAEWYDRAEAREVVWRTASIVFLLVSLSSGVWTLAVTSGWMSPVDLAGAGACVIAGLILLLPILATSTYNRFVSTRIRVENAWAHIDADLSARHDLIPNLVETVKAVSAHERNRFEEIAGMRSTGARRNGRKAALARETEFDGMSARLLAYAEQHPELKADEAHARLAKELTALEGKIAFGRVFYNDTVREHNTLIESFPNILYSALLGFRSLSSWRREER
jgi:LemA protein